MQLRSQLGAHTRSPDSQYWRKQKSTSQPSLWMRWSLLWVVAISGTKQWTTKISLPIMNTSVWRSHWSLWTRATGRWHLKEVQHSTLQGREGATLRIDLASFNGSQTRPNKAEKDNLDKARQLKGNWHQPSEYYLKVQSDMANQQNQEKLKTERFLPDSKKIVIFSDGDPKNLKTTATVTFYGSCRRDGAFSQVKLLRIDSRKLSSRHSCAHAKKRTSVSTKD